MSDRLPIRRLFAESVVVVGSILLAFAIDAAWDARGERAEAAELLRGLEEEFAGNLVLLSGAIGQSNRSRERLQEFISPEPIDLVSFSADTTQTTVAFLFVRDWGAELPTGFLDATIASGGLALLGDPDLRARVAAFHAEVNLSSEILRLLEGPNVRLAEMLGQYPEFRSGMSTGYGELSVATLEAMRADEELMALAAAKLVFWGGYLVSAGRLEQRLVETLDLIRQRRAEQ